MNDYSAFANPAFDANEYANAVLAGEPYPPQLGRTRVVKTTGFEPAKEDISVAISKLTFGIEDVSKQLKAVVTTHHEALLLQASSVSDLEGSFESVRHGLDDLGTSVDKLRLKIRIPYESLESHVARLSKLQQASDLLRRTARFVVVARRLEFQMTELSKTSESTNAKSNDPTSPSKAQSPNGSQQSPDTLDQEGEKERSTAKGALSIAELVSLLDTEPEVFGEVPTPTVKAPSEQALEKLQGNKVSLRSVNAVAAHIPAIDAARARVTMEMESMVLTGLATLNQSLLASSLQTAYNLRVLPDLVHSLVADLTEAVDTRIRTAFDVSRISKDAAIKEPTNASPSLLYKSRVRTEPTNVTAPQWAAALWARLESLIEEMADCCIKVYTLEKVLRLKKDTVSQVVFLDEAMKLLENKPSLIFWTTLARSLDKQSRDATKGSTFLQQTLSTGYPRLLRLFHEFFAKIAVHTDTTYTHSHQSPETVLILRALSNFEALYLSRSSNRLNEAVAQAFAAGTRSPPGMGEGIGIARTISNELDAAKFDPLLVRSVAKNVVSSLDLLLARIDGMFARDRSSITLLGPMATPQQIINAQLTTCLYNCWSRLEKLEGEYPEDVISILRHPIKNLFRAFERGIDPLLAAIQRELSAIIARLHRVDFSRPMDINSGFGAGPSGYMKDLVDKLNFIKTEIMSKYNLTEASRTWIMTIVKNVVRTFVLHVSIAKPLGESGKLQLTSDMTEIEFALSAFMADGSQNKRGSGLDMIGADYLALRAMRQLLFLENAQLASAENTVGLPPLIVLHHILVRSPIPLPHTLHGWQEAEYIRWVGEHSEEEAWTLVEGGLAHWEKINEAEGGDAMIANEYIQLARSVLRNVHRS